MQSQFYAVGNFGLAVVHVADTTVGPVGGFVKLRYRDVTVSGNDFDVRMNPATYAALFSAPSSGQRSAGLQLNQSTSGNGTPRHGPAGCAFQRSKHKQLIALFASGEWTSPSIARQAPALPDRFCSSVRYHDTRLPRFRLSLPAILDKIDGNIVDLSIQA